MCVVVKININNSDWGRTLYLIIIISPPPFFRLSLVVIVDIPSSLQWTPPPPNTRSICIWYNNISDSHHPSPFSICTCMHSSSWLVLVTTTKGESRSKIGRRLFYEYLYLHFWFLITYHSDSNHHHHHPFTNKTNNIILFYRNLSNLIIFCCLFVSDIFSYAYNFSTLLSHIFAKCLLNTDWRLTPSLFNASCSRSSESIPKPPVIWPICSRHC